MVYLVCSPPYRIAAATWITAAQLQALHQIMQACQLAASITQCTTAADATTAYSHTSRRCSTEQLLVMQRELTHQLLQCRLCLGRQRCLLCLAVRIAAKSRHQLELLRGSNTATTATAAACACCAQVEGSGGRQGVVLWC